MVRSLSRSITTRRAANRSQSSSSVSANSNRFPLNLAVNCCCNLSWIPPIAPIYLPSTLRRMMNGATLKSVRDETFSANKSSSSNCISHLVDLETRSVLLFPVRESRERSGDVDPHPVRRLPDLALVVVAPEAEPLGSTLLPRERDVATARHLPRLLARHDPLELQVRGDHDLLGWMRRDCARLRDE